MNAWLLALAIGVCGGAAVWLILARDLLRVVVGLALAGTAVNLFVLMAGRVGSGVPAIMADSEAVLAATAANPLPQALVLTAIVIGFAFVCLALVLLMALLAKRPEGDVDRLADAEPGAGADGKPLPFDAERRA